jgi:hypothetical protein
LEIFLSASFEAPLCFVLISFNHFIVCLDETLRITNLDFQFVFLVSLWFFSGTKSLTDSRRINTHMEELSRMVEAVKGVLFVNAVVVEMKNSGNHYRIEKVVLDRVVARDVIHRNML